jgi:uncharacterized protein DUF2510
VDHLQGWQPDPYGRYEHRYFSAAGEPTVLVRDGGVESRDEGPSETPTVDAGQTSSPPAAAQPTASVPAVQGPPNAPLPGPPTIPVAPSDWHPDPLNPGRLRYWDGRSWTEHVATPSATAGVPLGAPATLPPIPTSPAAAQARNGGGSKRTLRWVAVVATVVVLVVVLTVIVTSGNKKKVQLTTSSLETPPTISRPGGSTPAKSIPFTTPATTARTSPRSTAPAPVATAAPDPQLAQPAPASTTTTTTAAPPPGQVIFSTSGSGIQDTQIFTVPTSWNLEWTYDCSSSGGQGEFTYSGFSGSNLNGVYGPIEVGGGGSGTGSYHQSGTMYLDIISGCAWSIKVVTA